MAKIYRRDVIEDRIETIGAADDHDSSGPVVSYKGVLCDPKYSKATMIGCTLSMFQQLTGINFIMLYSNTLFGNLNMSAQNITGLVGVVNFFSVFGGLALLTMAGRRSIWIWVNLAIAVILILEGIFSLSGHETLSIIFTMAFIVAFELAPGPILLLYCAEIMQDKGISLALVVNWVMSLGISMVTPSLLRAIGDDNIGYIFIVMGGCTLVGSLFAIKFMKETRGKTKAQIEVMFRKQE
uniref:Major facilitator superfamily (MFS) profile domain-containing protein n=1 Tax=Strombidium inclinatum TaxID=197538 RepID=A0A7S3IZB7_9SPIT|mmetsp:Transcript_6030/g.9740  ORF Transcript_6030/g.9740 Transcript_6030/m.9740 type:complete len:239 (+) Transcript_6030:707-1423(+)